MNPAFSQLYFELTTKTLVVAHMKLHAHKPRHHSRSQRALHSLKQVGQYSEEKYQAAQSDGTHLKYRIKPQKITHETWPLHWMKLKG